MGVFCDRLKLCSTAALDCRTGQNKGEKELSFLLVSLSVPLQTWCFLLQHLNQTRFLIISTLPTAFPIISQNEYLTENLSFLKGDKNFCVFQLDVLTLVSKIVDEFFVPLSVHCTVYAPSWEPGALLLSKNPLFWDNYTIDLSPTVSNRESS